MLINPLITSYLKTRNCSPVLAIYGQQIGQRNGKLFLRKVCPISNQDVVD
jgi:hypothetical protein